MSLIGEEIANANMQSPSELQQLEGRAIADAALDAAHVAARDVRVIGERLLRQLTSFAQLADTSTESLQGGMFGGLASLARHDQDAGATYPLGPRSIGYNDDDEESGVSHRSGTV